MLIGDVVLLATSISASACRTWNLVPGKEIRQTHCVVVVEAYSAAPGWMDGSKYTNHKGHSSKNT